MSRHKEIVQELFSRCGITINGQNYWDIQVHDDRMYARVLKEKNLGLGETYMDGWWDCSRVDEFIYRIITCGLDQKVRGSYKLLFPYVDALFSSRQSKTRAEEVAEKHYDRGNDLFLSYLDSYNQYSCAFFQGTSDLEQAQRNKMDLICRKVNIKEGDRVLDIGFGWGGLAKYMVENYRCSVTGCNISEEQVNFARESYRHLPISIAYCDYRDLQGKFDKVVSVGMFEHVGIRNYRTFMQVVHNCLQDEGIFLLHTIGKNESQMCTDAWITKYIFPNGQLPSIAQVSRAVEGLFVLEDLHNFGPHYDKTLMAWHRRFQEAWPRLKDKYDIRFKRMWDYYLQCCAGSFRARDIQLWQFVFTKYHTPQPECRC
ncbi:MAG: cyclopropane fatty acyl phospholipid synthase [Desulfomonile tiedjei]|uniref:Cyclopropane fatty acyl phospholipid synthase n=1 Tax=Desulfomonile tiedjei TaxID=2358 RepID=A0A9D6V0Q6_9BACT|nr:cyclopropane fatty acyl phospholipid synthase [Desulfomonile tiedjei]